MPWYSKVAWSEGLFLQPQHLQQADRYVENLVRARSEATTPYPWGFVEVQIDRNLLQQGFLGLRAAVGVMPDGTPFETPGGGPLPTSVAVPEDGAGLNLWLTLPDAPVGHRAMAPGESDEGARWRVDPEDIADVASTGRAEQVIDVATPRLGLAVRKSPRPGTQSLRLGRVAEVRDGVVVLDPTVPPVAFVLRVHPEYLGYLDRVIGWIEARIGHLAQYASDPGAGGGLHSSDYLMLMVLNRELPVLKHLRHGRNVHPERLFERLIGLAGELSSFDQGARRAPELPPYVHDDAQATFPPVVLTIQDFLARDVGRAVPLEVERKQPNYWTARVRDRQLYQRASFVVVVGAAMPLSQIRTQFPLYCKVGPVTLMQRIVEQNLPGVPVEHLPNPPRQIRVIAEKVYFLFDKNSPHWPDFAASPGVGLHLTGDWPQLSLELWAVPDATS